MIILTWFFATPTPIIAVISALIAYLAYNHQRELKKKALALELAEVYSKNFIPRMRYIDSILHSIGAKKYIEEFSNPSEFTENELINLLKKQSGTVEKFKKLFSKIKTEHLHLALSNSGANEYISKIHLNFIELSKNSEKHLENAVYKFTLDFLNDMEAFASNFYFNIAQEELVYPILHQTFFSHMKNWYFFIAHKNNLDHDRFYPFIIWLYDKWYQRKVNKRNSLNERLTKGYQKNRLH